MTNRVLLRCLALTGPVLVAVAWVENPENARAATADAGTADATTDAKDAGAKTADAGPTEAPFDGGTARYIVRDGVVFDTRTRLYWQQAVPTDPLAWAAGEEYCSTLKLDGATWRLPSVAELQTLIDETRLDPAIDPIAFPDTPSEYFWTSSSPPRFAGFVWSVYFGFGLSTFFDVAQERFVRCVH